MRLIDANELIDNIRRKAKAGFPANKNLFLYAESCVIHAPTVDAVPVVRCKDCKYFNLQSMECENDAVSTDHEGGASYSLNFYLDDFCSYGERKDNE